MIHVFTSVIFNFALKHNPLLRLTSSPPIKATADAGYVEWKVLLKLGGNIRHFQLSGNHIPTSTVPLPGSTINHGLKITSLSPTEAIHQPIFPAGGHTVFIWILRIKGTKNSTAGHYFGDSSDLLENSDYAIIRNQLRWLCFSASF